MNEWISFFTGPALWASLAIFFFGSLLHVVRYVKNLDWQLDRVSYGRHLFFGIKGALRSVCFWMTPFATRSWRMKPVYTLMFYLFHVGGVVVPLFLSAHAVIIKSRWGITIPTLPDAVADFLTVGVLVGALGMLCRRLMRPEVRRMTTCRELGTLILAVAPFLTGFLAYHQVGNASFWTLAHIISGEMLLVAIPFTRLSHMVFFFCSRIQIGMDFGIKRGGMKSVGMPV
ncbi:MAG: hypothetical protein MI742_03090 [Desulfobacterales bacterium]|nr:hypothetical protein [Desulfobacterales bacterium]